MVNPGIFRGLRKEFLLSQKPLYAEAVTAGHAKETVGQIQRRFFKRFPVDLPLDEEPSQSDLDAVDDDAADDEQPEPDQEMLTEEEYSSESKRLEERATLVEKRKEQIRHWLRYQYMKDHDPDNKDVSSHPAYRALLFQLTGVGTVTPRRKTAFNLWRTTQRVSIEAEAREEIKALGLPNTHLATTRSKIAQRRFSALDDKIKQHWIKEVQIDYDARLENTTTCIDGLTKFMQPILDLVCQATGWKATFIAGGPEPVLEGRLSVLSVHSGTTSGDLKLNFGKAERQRLKKVVVPIFGDFLRKCFTPDECRARSLTSLEGNAILGSTVVPGVEDVHWQSELANMQLVDDVRNTLGLQLAAAPPQVDAPSSSMPEPLAPLAVEYAEAPVAQVISNEAMSPLRSSTPPLPPLFNVIASPSPAVVICTNTNPNPTQGDSASVPPSVQARAQPSPPPTPAGARSCPSTPPCNTSPLCFNSSPLFAGGHSPVLDGFLQSPMPSPPSHKRRSEVLEATGNAPPSKRLHVLDEASPSSTTEPHPSARTNPTRRRVAPSKVPTLLTTIPTTTTTIRPGTSHIAAHATAALASATTLTPQPPTWFQSASSMFLSEDVKLGGAWKTLVQKWALFEAKEAYEGGKALPAAQRPGPVSEWIIHKRIATFRPNIGNVQRYQKEYERWWDIAKAGLCSAGVNGSVSVMAALFFWGIHVMKGRSTKARSVWESHVEDCTAAFEAL